MNKPRFEFAVGLFVTIGFVILLLIVFFVSGVYIFRSGYHLRAVFDYVGIINRGAPVRFAGVTVGEVSEVKILTPAREGENAKVELTFFIEEGTEIRERYPIGIRGTHIMSEPHIEITPVPDGGRVLKEGDVITNGLSPSSTDELIQRLDSAAQELDKILGEVGGALENDEMRQMLRDSLANMNRILASLNVIIVGREDEYRDMVINLNRVATQLGELLERINQGEGTLGKLIVEDEIYNDLRDFVRDIKANPWRLLKKK